MKTVFLKATLQKDLLRITFKTEEELKSSIYSYEEISIDLEKIKNICKDNYIRIKNNKNLITMGAMLCNELLTFNIKSKLLNTYAEYLILTIDDNLVHIPWELIFLNDKFLCERFSIGRVVQTHQHNIYPKNSKAKRSYNMWILVNPCGDLEDANFEADELIEIIDSLNPDDCTFINADSDSNLPLEKVLSNIRKSDIVHFAGHAVYNYENPNNSGWKLTNGYMTAIDIDKMLGSQMPVLVFSNACQSARTIEWKKKENVINSKASISCIKKDKGISENLIRTSSSERFVDTSFQKELDINESFSLANAFLRAGVRCFIGTYWKIMDEPSSYFAIEFYKHFLAGETIGKSIKQARLFLINKYGHDFIEWASYVLYGDPLFTLEEKISINKIEKKRRVDAIAPVNAHINQQVDIIVQVRFPNSPFLDTRDVPIKHKPSLIDRGSATFELVFPTNSSGVVQSTVLDVKIITTHFSIEGSNRQRLEIPPDRYSKRVLFYLIAKKKGIAE